MVVTEDRVTLTVNSSNGKQTSEVRVDADYAINKESCLFGVIDSCDGKSSPAGDFPEQLELTGQPFCVRFRVEGDALSFKDFKGFSLEHIEERRHVVSLIAAVCGRYTKVDPSKVVSPRTSSKSAPVYNSDPLIRQDELLRQSEDQRQLGETWRRFWFNDQPSHLTPQRIHGGILKADPPKEEAKDHNTMILPPLKKGEKPVSEAPTDAEVMRVFNERRAKEVGKGFELAQDEIVIVKNNVKDKIGPPRFYPLVGFAQLHEASWECGVYYVDTRGGKRKPKVEVISICKDHLHLWIGVNPDALSEMTKGR